jgi:restriction system protein
MGRRGFFAELQHQSRLAERNRERAQREAARNYERAVREREQAEKAEERASLQLSKANVAERKRLEKEAAEPHIAAKEAEVEERNLQLQQTYEEIDSLLSSTLEIDDFVDLNTLRVTPQHPIFNARGLEVPLPRPPELPLPKEPTLALPDPPTGLGKFFGMRKHEEAIAEAKREHEQAVTDWRVTAMDVIKRRKLADEAYARDDAKRLERLTSAQANYQIECAARDADAEAKNRQVSDLIANLGYGSPDAIQEYIGIVLSNSVYPDHFEVEYEFEFDSATAELKLRASVPAPASIPTIKAYKYAKALDTVTSTDLPQKDCRDRYASAIYQVALRSLHEVFEADRRGLVRTIALEVGTRGIDPATGHPADVCFVRVGAERDSFLQLQLAAVIPSATLTRLRASLSKNPYALAPADRAGVRRT